MLIQILSHTPIYVWAILAFLVWRGVNALREREITARKLCIIPLVMLALSLQDIAVKFGPGAADMAAWLAGAALGALLAWKFGSARTSPGGMPGSVRVAGSPLPLLMMLAVFFTKYLASVLLAVQPALRQDTAFAFAVCALFGLFNGWFGGRLARDLRAAVPARPASAAV
jgi:hypothetical protein